MPLLFLLASSLVLTHSSALAQATDQGHGPMQPGIACPPGISGEPPTEGHGSSPSLSDRLAESKGVICPPAELDPQMQVAPPAGGHMKVIPPPGTPGGNQNVQPK